jgi:hypothetical protein
MSIAITNKQDVQQLNNYLSGLGNIQKVNFHFSNTESLQIGAKRSD